MSRGARVVMLPLVVGLLAMLCAAAIAAPARAAETVYVARISGGINAATADYVIKAVERAAEDRAAALVLELDTPGGQLGATKDIVGSFLNARVPVIVYVWPRGAWAASAGTFITMAGHVAAMAPGTTIGAAHPVDLFGGDPGGPAPPAQPGPVPGSGPTGEPESTGGSRPGSVMGQKIENMVAAFGESIAQERGRNVEWAIRAVRESVAVSAREAVDENIVDLIASDLDDLLRKVDGREVKVGEEPVVLQTQGARVQRIDMSLINQFFDFLGNPQLAGLLLLAGLAGLYIEVTNPGGIWPGVIGVACLILSGLALQVIPFNWLGLILILAGIALMGIEAFVPTFGVLFALGVASLAIGGYMLFDVPEIGDAAISFWSVIFPAVLTLSVLGAVLVFVVSRSVVRPVFAGSGPSGLIGQVAVVDTAIDPHGRVRLQGELWNAEADERIEPGERVQVESVTDLVVHVVRATDSDEKGR